jgi:threonine/homoserine/homoserine lactone efflux protein
MSSSKLLGFCVAAFAIIAVPGPSVLFTIARGIPWGRAIAVLTVLGNSLGVLVLSFAVAVGLGPLLTRSAAFTEAIEVAGGAYLLWLGVEALVHRREHAEAMAGRREPVRPRPARVVRQGFVVGFLNPKALVFFVAVFPHFVDQGSGNVTLQLFALGLVFAAIAMVSDSAWGIAAGSARAWLLDSPRHLVALRTTGACVMLGLGVVIIVSAAA